MLLFFREIYSDKVSRGNFLRDVLLTSSFVTRPTPTLIIRFLFQVYVGLSELYCRLHDAEKSAKYAARAYDLSRSLQLGDLNSRHHRAALLQMAAALRKKGDLGDAHDYCSVKFQLKITWEGKLTFLRSKIRSHHDSFTFPNDFEQNVSQRYRKFPTNIYTCNFIIPHGFILITRDNLFVLCRMLRYLREKSIRISNVRLYDL